MEHVDRIVELWNTLVGYDRSKVGADGIDRHNNYHVVETLKELNRARQLDTSDALYLMLVDEFLDKRLSETTVSALSYLADPTPFDRTLELARQIRALLADSGMPEVREELTATVKRALDHYGAGDREDVRKLLDTRGATAFLWRDALEAMERSLDTHQFLRGEPDTGVKPQYQQHVLGFWSINDALRLCARMPSGVSLCLIRDAHAIRSHFAFVIRNGGNLWVITDKDNFAHPLAAGMRRRPDRDLDARMGRSRFPYELLDIEYLTDEDGDVVGLNVPRQEGIIPAQTRAFKVRPIRDIGADEVTWTAMMFALCTRRFFGEVRQLPELSYTGEMAEVPHMIEKVASDAGLPVAADAYSPLQAPALSSAELTRDRVEKDAMAKSTGVNEWMVERYGHSVRDDLLTPVGAPATSGLYLEDPSGEPVRKDREKVKRDRFFDREEPAEIVEFDATGFGSAEKVLADRVWIARHNQATLVSMAAAEEFVRRHEEVLSWYRSAVEANVDRLEQAIRDNRFEVHSDRLVQGSGFVNRPRGNRSILQRHVLRTHALRNAYEVDGLRVSDNWDLQVGVRFGHMGDDGRTWRCFRSGRPAQDIAVFTPQTVDDLAAVAGVPVSGLPDVLQHWNGPGYFAGPYIGNPILDRIDPMDYVAKNPWSELKVAVGFHLSMHVFPRPSAAVPQETAPASR